MADADTRQSTGHQPQGMTFQAGTSFVLQRNGNLAPQPRSDPPRQNQAQSTDDRPPHYIILSAFTCLFINHPLGFMALVSSLLSLHYASHGDLQQARMYSDLSFGAIIIGWVLSFLFLLTMGYLYTRRRIPSIKTG